MNRLALRQAVGDVFYRAGRQRPSAGTLSVLMYHAVTAEALQDQGQASVPAALFEEQMMTLRRLGIELVSLTEGVARVIDGCTTPLAAVVFDDGYAGVHAHALETLRRQRIPATLFVTTQWIGQPAFPWAPPALGRPLTWEEIARLVRDAGCDVGSHTHTHARLTALGAVDVRRELQASRALIRERLGITPTSFAYPYGSYGAFNARTRQALVDEGFAVACANIWGRFERGDDPLCLKRIRVSWCDSAQELRKSLAGCYDWYRLLQRRQRMAWQTDHRGAEECLAS